MPDYRVSVVLTFVTSVDVDDAKTKEEAIKRGIGFVRDAVAVEAYAVDHIKVTAKTKATRLPKEKPVDSKHGKAKKAKS